MIPKPTYGYQKQTLTNTTSPMNGAINNSVSTTSTSIPAYTNGSHLPGPSLQHHHTILKNSNGSAVTTSNTNNNSSHQQTQHTTQQPHTNASLLNKLSFQYKLAKFQQQSHPTQPVVASMRGIGQTTHSDAKPVALRQHSLETPAVAATSRSLSTSNATPANNSNGFTLTLNQSSAVLAAAAAAAASAATSASHTSTTGKY